MIYYGDELGLHGGADPDNRRPLPPRDAWHQERLARTRRWSRLRREHPALRHGRYVSLAQPGTDVVAFARVPERVADTLVFVANATARSVAATLFLPLPQLYDALPLEDRLGGLPTRAMASGTLSLTLPPHGVALLAPRDDLPGGYRFFKPHTR
jgi:alpha-glucosidase